MPRNTPGYVRVKTIEVVDGDSFNFEFDLLFRISFAIEGRLASLDTPEKNTPAGLDVKEWVKAWLKLPPTHDSFLMWQSLKLEKFGRSLGILGWTRFPNMIEVPLNTILLARGMAKEFDGTGKRSWTEQELQDVRTAVKTAPLLQP